MVQKDRVKTPEKFAIITPEVRVILKIPFIRPEDGVGDMAMIKPLGYLTL